jgi:hypothetical protein
MISAYKDLEFIQTINPIGIQSKVQFGGYVLSIVKNEVSYGGEEGLYEIAVYKGDFQEELPGITNDNDTVKGFLTSGDVDAIIKKMYLVTGTEGKQI